VKENSLFGLVKTALGPIRFDEDYIEGEWMGRGLKEINVSFVSSGMGRSTAGIIPVLYNFQAVRLEL
jgi:hypothetical protein